MIGVSCCQGHEFAEAAELVARHRDAIEPLLTHDFSLEEAPQAIVYASEHPADVMKAVVHVA
jgi:threonine dehydrogenase-like Zn-dependent dehydrogenase